MCFKTSINAKPIKAKQDIICYKIMYPILERNRNGKFCISLFQGYIYQLGYRYRENLGFDISYTNTRSRKGSSHYNSSNESSKYIVINRGIHSYMYQSIAEDHNFSKISMIYECIIPKGSTYYFDPVNMEYCSNEIAIMKRISS